MAYPIPPWLQPSTDWGALAQRKSIAEAEMMQRRQEMDFRQSEIAQRTAMQQQEMDFRQSEIAQRTAMQQQELEVKAKELAQQSLEFNQRIAMQQQQLQTETQVKQQALEQQANLAEHRMAIEQAYNTARVGIQEGQLRNAQAKVALDYQKAAREYAQRQEFERIVGEGIKSGKTPEDSFQEAVLTRGVGLSIPPGVLSAVARNSERGNFKPSETMVGNTRLIQTSPNQYRFAPESSSEASITPDAFGMMKVQQNGKTHYIKMPAFKFSAQKELEELAKYPYLDENIDIPASTRRIFGSEIEAKRKRYKELLALKDKEMAAFQGGSRPSSTSTNRITFEDLMKQGGSQ